MSSLQHKISCLTAAAQATPEYAEIVPLFVELFRYTEQAGATGISVTINRAAMKEKIEGGFPLIAPHELQVDESVCRSFLSGAIATLKRCGNGGLEELSLLSDALNGATIECRPLFEAILARDRKTIDELALALSVPSPLVEYVFEIPLKRALEQSAESLGAGEVAGWQEGYCPVCGSRAGMAELVGEEGKRHLSCSACGFLWQFKRLQCPFCGNDSPEQLSYFTAGDGPTRVDACKACSRYIKTRDSRKGNAEVPLDVEDLLTLHLDLLAAKEGFERGK